MLQVSAAGSSVLQVTAEVAGRLKSVHRSGLNRKTDRSRVVSKTDSPLLRVATAGSLATAVDRKFKIRTV